MNNTISNFIKNIIPFLPLVALYVALILFFSPNQLVGDELRHVKYATNLTQGFYTDADNPSLRNGPAYPLIIALPVLAEASPMLMRFLNVGFMALALVFFYKSLLFFLKQKQALIITYIFGLYPPLLKSVIGVISEPLAMLSICCFLYYFLKVNKEPKARNTSILLSSLSLGLLAMTKVFFGYVILCGILVAFLFFILRKSKKSKAILFIFLGGFLLCIPYLGYTYSVTGKAFLWGTQGGEMLYWRTTPFEKEYGNWIGMETVLNSKNSEFHEISQLYKNHGAFIESLKPRTYLERDSIFKAKAVENIKKNPIPYIKNTGTSIGRMFFNYPFSYTPQKISTYVFIIPNMFLLVFLFIATFIALRKIREIPLEVIILSIIALSFIGGLSLLDGRVRHFSSILPLLLFLIAFVFNQFVQVTIKDRLTEKS